MEGLVGIDVPILFVLPAEFREDLVEEPVDDEMAGEEEPELPRCEPVQPVEGGGYDSGVDDDVFVYGPPVPFFGFDQPGRLSPYVSDVVGYEDRNSVDDTPSVYGMYSWRMFQ